MELEVMGDETFGPDQMWSSDPILVLHFPFRSHFQKFISEISRIMVKYMNRDPYNSVSSFVGFYEEFKKQDLDLMNFYETVHKPTIRRESQNCIGKALYLRRKLLKHSRSEYPDLQSYLHIGTCNPYLANDIPKSYHQELPRKTDCLKDHSCLVMKFTLESRRRQGFIILDPGFLIDFPVVIMKDGEAPNTGKFEIVSKTGGKSYDFKYYNENYVYWLTETYDALKSANSSAEHRWFYVGKKLQNVLQIEKRNRMNTYHALAFADLGGAVVAFFTILGAKDHIELSVRDGDPTSKTGEEVKFNTYKIPFVYFLPEGGPRKAEWEQALKLLDDRFRRFDDINELFRRLAVLATDAPFVQELTKINDSWRYIIESSFNP